MEFALIALDKVSPELYSVRSIDMDSFAGAACGVTAIAAMDAVPGLLKVLCEIAGMKVALVTRATDNAPTICAVKDAAQFGLHPGMTLPLDMTFRFDSLAPLVIEHASTDPRCSNQQRPKRYPVESCVSVPITRANGEYFGDLAAFDPRPAKIAGPHILTMFREFAAIIAGLLDNQLLREKEHRELLDERAAGELREEFVAILGHDLRNPLHAIYATGDLLERKLSDPDLSGMASRIKANVRRMSALIDDVLDFARGRLGDGIGLELTEIENINTGLATVIQELRDAQPDSIILSDIHVNRAVRCDLGRFQQVASNLLGNALTHGLAGSPVKIRATVDEEELVLEVWNAGEPIPAESLGKIFEPFWRHSVSASRNGLGLGLHICSQIVRAHDGRLSVTSSREHGTQFTARLPLGAQNLRRRADRRPPSSEISRSNQ